MNQKNSWQTQIVSFSIVSMIMIVLFCVRGYAPFGENALTWGDADIQYLDFFAYLKDVLEGKNDITYTFSKLLGGSSIAIFSYYLASPFNLLVVFFEKENLHIFFHLVVLLKIALSAATFSYFLSKRFNSKNKLFNVILSVGYGLSQYNIAQSSNIMWLDGVYMLPLILEAVYELVSQKKTWKLSVVVGLSILFNWYTGGINCLFSIFWFVFEVLLQQCETVEKGFREIILDCIVLLWKYGIAMVLGVVLSAALFLPTIGALQSSNKGSLSLNMLLDFSFTGNVVSVIQSYTLGSQSQYGNVSLFCGSLGLIGSIACLLSKGIKTRKKIILVCMVVFSLMLFYWRPLFVLFSLLKSADSYWYRYSYCGIIVLLFLSAYYFLNNDLEKNILLLLKIAIIFSGLLLVLNYLNWEKDLNRVYYTVIFILGITMTIVLYIYFCDRKTYRLIVESVLLSLIILEALYSTKYQMDYYHVSNVNSYQAYVEENIKQVEELKQFDKEEYRVSQTSTRNTEGANLTANYNESLANSYWSVSSYTSTPDDISQNFIDKLGYPIYADCISVVNTSILPADSLMSTKYILSQYPINGLELVEELNVYNGKAVYENPYCLPLAFTYKENDFDNNYTEENPFSYQNYLYSKLLGRKVDLFVPLDYEIVEKGNIDKNIPQRYKILIPEGDYVLYGNIPTESGMDAVLDVNDVYQTGYSCWLAPEVFLIPIKDEKKEVTLTLRSDTIYATKEDGEQFYALDLKTLKNVSEELKNKKADKWKIQNGYANFEVETLEDNNLYISIPYNEGWKITVNDKKITPSLFENCFYSIPLEKGKNFIEMRYEVQYLKAGILISLFGSIVIGTIWRKQCCNKNK